MLPIIMYRRLDGANGRNGIGWIIINPDADQWAAVGIQELIEEKKKRSFAYAVWWRWTNEDNEDVRQRECLGHMAEALVSAQFYGQDLMAALRREAMAMQRGYGGIFASWPIAKIIHAMELHQREAQRFIDANGKVIREIMAKERKHKAGAA
ncbi:MAG: hypothetical protein VYB46_08655 [Pseudomonadota bacterium]|nr:hypothetical protein [Pseudomonadota bacterium]